MKKTIYIAGQILAFSRNQTSDKVEQALKFKNVQKEIEMRGFKAVNPILLTDGISNPQFAKKMRLMALKNCEGIYMLPCSVDCPDAQDELQTAILEGMLIYSELHELNNDNKNLYS